MSKTVFNDTPPTGTIVTANFLNAVNNHRHTGRNIDGDGAIDYAVSTGSANAYALTLSPALDAQIAGMSIRFKANFTNTGPATININGLGAVEMKKNGSTALVSGDIVAGTIYEIFYDGTNFQILNQLSPALYYASSTGNDYEYNVSYSPALAAHVAGLPLFFKANHANAGVGTGPTTVKFNSLGAVAIKKATTEGIVNLERYDIVSGQIVEVVYDGTYYQIKNPNKQHGYNTQKHVNGWEIRPSGIIEQWGIQGDFGGAPTSTISFPVAFPHACLNAHATAIGNSSIDNGFVQVQSFSKTDLIVREQASYLTGKTDGFYWLAIGY